MTRKALPHIHYVVGPDGSPLTITDLPPMNINRWVVHRKAEVVSAVRGGLLSINTACERYNLSIDELFSWYTQFMHHGLAGLKVTKPKSNARSSTDVQLSD